jgi:hypothetical protein
MNEITIPYHFTIALTLSLLGLVTILFLRKRFFKLDNGKLLWVSSIIFLTVYLFIVGQATYEDVYCQWDVNKYDLDMDGFFSERETTKEQEAAMQRLTNDTGRNFSVITGLGFSTIISTATYFMTTIYFRLQRNDGRK